MELQLYFKSAYFLFLDRDILSTNLSLNQKCTFSRALAKSLMLNREKMGFSSPFSEKNRNIIYFIRLSKYFESKISIRGPH